MTAVRSAPMAAERVALGMALGRRAEESVRRTWELANRSSPYRYSAEYDEVQRQRTYFGTLFVARWLVCGMETDEEEHAWLTLGSRLAVAEAVPTSRTMGGYYAWRDAVIEILSEEAERLDTPDAIRRAAVHMARRSCDASLLRMAREMDRHRDRVTAALAESEQRFRSLYRSMACGVVLVNAEGRVIDCNDAALAIIGVDEATLRRADLFHVEAGLHDEQGRPVTPLALEAVSTGRTIRGRVVEMPGGDTGRRRWVQGDAVPMLDAGGVVTEVLLTFIDVTAVREAEQARAESEAKTRFLATMSHELRTPLNSVLGFAQLLRMRVADRIDEKERRYLDNIESSGRHLLSLINDVLDLTRVAAGHLRVGVERVHVGEVLAEVRSELLGQAEQKGLRLECTCADGLVARADRIRTRQAVTNLVANSLKFTVHGRVTMSAAARAGGVEIVVADTGIGIPPEHLERVFDEFTQVDAGTNRSHEGSGLGLPLARRLVELMGGQLTMESTVAAGTTARIWLPAAD